MKTDSIKNLSNLFINLFLLAVFMFLVSLAFQAKASTLAVGGFDQVEFKISCSSTLQKD